MTATERVRLRLREMHRDRRFSQKAVADALGSSQSNISKLLSDESRPITLAHLEAFSEFTQVPVAELVADDASIKQVNADEALILRALRSWPSAVVRAFCVVVTFFADEEPAAGQTRNLHQYWREMPAKEREWFYGVAVLLREGSLPPDVQEGLVERLTAERYTREAAGAKRRRKQA